MLSKTISPYKSVNDLIKTLSPINANQISANTSRLLNKAYNIDKITSKSTLDDIFKNVSFIFNENNSLNNYDVELNSYRYNVNLKTHLNEMEYEKINLHLLLNNLVKNKFDNNSSSYISLKSFLSDPSKKVLNLIDEFLEEDENILNKNQALVSFLEKIRLNSEINSCENKKHVKIKL